MAVMIGRVENDEPIPMVTTRPTTRMASAAAGRLPSNRFAADCTSASMSPVLVMTAAKPWAVIMMKPMRAIMRMPAVKTSSDSFHFTAPEAMKIAKPTSAPTSSESASSSRVLMTSWMPKQATIAISETMIL